ncbi:hypothetical protein SCLCIDRAFT_1211294 [Scleroderma citrinum Foug A]|uniref:Uncharacterized protein n=1 Tax=Scleroderma citrinum Foug A TaxID=1036808 RepID=A0A0C3EF49_9AGAM|nr:hypothetical protein SCLCIDRAFT_1211294 [Scleroderma citrinum Foug A]
MIKTRSCSWCSLPGYGELQAGRISFELIADAKCSATASRGTNDFNAEPVLIRRRVL